MNNPILQMMTNNNGNMLNIISALKNGNPDAMLNGMMQSNPQFRQFMQDNKGKTPEQIAQAYGIDFKTVQSFLR